MTEEQAEKIENLAWNIRSLKNHILNCDRILDFPSHALFTGSNINVETNQGNYNIHFLQKEDIMLLIKNTRDRLREDLIKKQAELEKL